MKYALQLLFHDVITPYCDVTDILFFLLYRRKGGRHNAAIINGDTGMTLANMTSWTVVYLQFNVIMTL